MERLLLAVMVVSAGAMAQAPRDRAELRHDAREAARDRREVWHDWADVERLEGLLGRFDAARGRGDARALAEIDVELQLLVRAEVREDAAKVVEQKRELRQDGRDLRKDKRDVGKDLVDGRVGAVVHDAKDVRQDRGELAEDRAHTAGERVNYERVRAAQGELMAVLGRVDGPALDVRRALMAELVGFARQEAARNAREVREDRRKIGEDRRELREGLRGH